MQFKVWIALNYMQFKYLNICFCSAGPMNQSQLYELHVCVYTFHREKKIMRTISLSLYRVIYFTLYFFLSVCVLLVRSL